MWRCFVGFSAPIAIGGVFPDNRDRLWQKVNATKPVE